MGLGATGACSGGFGCYQYQNIKASTLAGLEGELSADVAKAAGRANSVEPYVTFTWLQTRKNRDASQFITLDGHLDETLPNTPAWMVSYGIKYAEPRLKLSTRLNAAYYGELLTQDWSVVDYVTVFSAPYYPSSCRHRGQSECGQGARRVRRLAQQRERAVRRE
ncbi:MAG: TonB-dependent receptor [Vicinamibacterales bacterium]